MAINHETFKEIKKIIIGEAILLAVMFAVFFIIGKFDFTVLYGGLLGGISNILYFLLICLSVNNVLDEKNLNQSKVSIVMSYYTRLTVLGICIAIGLYFDCFHNIAVIIPVLATKPILYVAELLGKGVKK